MVYLMTCNDQGEWGYHGEFPDKQSAIPAFKIKLQQMLDEGFIIVDDWREMDMESPNIEPPLAVVFEPSHLLCVGHAALNIKTI